MTDTEDRVVIIVIEIIPIERITVLNPRLRDRKKFREIVDSIRKVGLKQPIKVSRTTGVSTAKSPTTWSTVRADSKPYLHSGRLKSLRSSPISRKTTACS